MDWLSYKSGTDIRFTAANTASGNANITADAIGAIARSFAAWLAKTCGRDRLSVAVGHDCRISADWITRAVIDALVECGCRVYDCGLCSTPSMFGMTRYEETRADGSVMVTASHHPFDKNGLKFFSPEGGLEGADIEAILRGAERGERLNPTAVGIVERADYMALYTASLLRLVRARTGEERPLEGLKIAVDAGNGAGGFFAARVLEPLGADVGASQFLDPDGYFPNHIPNPENRAAMRSISERVTACGADLGIIFDTDVDRAAVVSSDGKEINRNRLIALLAAIVLEETPGATIVTDSVTSDGLKEFIERKGGVHRRFRRGYRNVIDEAIRLERAGVDAPLAIETSGHAALKENAFLDDGAYVVIKILIALCRLRREGKTLLSLIEGLREPVEEAEVRIGYRVKDWRRAGEVALERLEREAKSRTDWHVADDSCEGVRVSTSEGFFLVRMSVHDPAIPINFEADVPGGVRAMQRELSRLLTKNETLDCSGLEEAIRG